MSGLGSRCWLQATSPGQEGHPGSLGSSCQQGIPSGAAWTRSPQRTPARAGEPLTTLLSLSQPRPEASACTSEAAARVWPGPTAEPSPSPREPGLLGTKFTSGPTGSAEAGPDRGPVSVAPGGPGREARTTGSLVLLLKKNSTERPRRGQRPSSWRTRARGAGLGPGAGRSLGRPRDDARGEVEEVAVDLAQVVHLVLQLGHADPQLVLAAEDALWRDGAQGPGSREASQGRRPHGPRQGAPHPRPGRGRRPPSPSCCSSPRAAAPPAPGGWAPSPATHRVRVSDGRPPGARSCGAGASLAPRPRGTAAPTTPGQKQRTPSAPRPRQHHGHRTRRDAQTPRTAGQPHSPTAGHAAQGRCLSPAGQRLGTAPLAGSRVLSRARRRAPCRRAVHRDAPGLGDRRATPGGARGGCQRDEHHLLLCGRRPDTLHTPRGPKLRCPRHHPNPDRT